MFMHTYDYTNRTNAILIDLQKKKISITFDFILLGFVESKGPRRKKKKNLINDSLLSKYVEQSKYEGTEE